MTIQKTVEEIDSTLNDLVNALCSLRIIKKCDEIDIHKKIEEILQRKGIPYLHEYHFGRNVRVDFYIEYLGIIIEVKWGNVNKKRLEYQIEKYAGYAKKIIVVMPKELGELPENIEDVDIIYIPLSRLWGVAI